MITLEWLYVLTGLVFSAWALLSLRDRTNPKRWGNAAFWGLLAGSFFFGSHISDLANGILVLVLVALAGTGQLGRSHPATTNGTERTALAARLGNRLFVPALVIPLTAVAGTLVYTYTPLGESGLFEARRETLILLGLGVLLALALAMLWMRAPLLAPLEEGRRLMDSIGWAAILPQMLAALGAVFALAGVGSIVGDLAGTVLPRGSLFLAVLVYCTGMLLFTVIMGNAFAAFPVMAAAIGIPVLVEDYGGNVALIGAVGMLAGFCGTLLTPMAANFNIVPAVLLDLRSQYGVIRAQVGTALPLFACNVLLIYFLAFP
ncbi:MULTISPECIES: DUF979 domain-containing protein [Novosphingobium]|uniref:DUF979 domain-containing protein n=1 Tax=Novosphingobium decolorationis TaxID=2698673 RepID=A0ABX8E6G6_9SPHN|nr:MULTISPECIES: DUF979 domain-containing protein [Novosphingobium]QVM84562.1 DUF979 domain-containing protein [Novosphingobium decolorationis]GAM04460.1 membrane protein [Novosphingobium sp. MBES04]